LRICPETVCSFRLLAPANTALKRSENNSDLETWVMSSLLRPATSPT
jgi:hypothetical protein